MTQESGREAVNK